MIDRSAEWLEQEVVESFWGENRPLKSLMVHFCKSNNGYPLKDAPAYIALEVTNLCNLQCTHCHYRHGANSYGREKGLMSLEVVEKAFREAQKHGFTILMNYDGEPLMHPEFINYLRLATDMGIKTYFNTNATLLTPEKTDELLEFYTGDIFVSMEGGKKWFEKIRQPAKYETVVDNFRYLIKQNEKRGHPLRLSISVSNLGQPLEERKAMLERWLPMVDAISFGEVNDEFGSIISTPLTQMIPIKRPLCATPWQTMGVCHNGDVVPCSIYIAKSTYKKVVMGNILEESISDIWRGERFEAFRKSHLEKGFHDEMCGKCERWRSQFYFPDEQRDGMNITRNGFWTVVTKQERE